MIILATKAKGDLSLLLSCSPWQKKGDVGERPMVLLLAFVSNVEHAILFF